jgi:hypothetical protein
LKQGYISVEHVKEHYRFYKFDWSIKSV